MHREGERAEARVGADVRRRLLAADMLLACRERQHKAALAVGIHGLADQAARHLPHVLFFSRKQADVGTAEAEAVANRLTLADHDVRAHLARWLQETERH